MSVYYSDDAVTLHHGHALDVLKTLPDGSVNCCVTSPPYFGLRSYLPADHPDKAREYGAESSPAEYVENMRVLFAEVRRVLADDGTLWLNLGDSYANGGGSNNGGYSAKSTLRNGNVRDGEKYRDANDNTVRVDISHDRPAKNLLGIPWRTAFALQDDSWILRNAIVWSKPNAMPESVTDRLSTRHELLFLFSKSRRYWFDLDAIKVDVTGHAPGRELNLVSKGNPDRNDGGNPVGGRGGRETRNPGDVWEIPTQPFPGAHFAVFPVEIPRRCIAAGCATRVCRECGHKPERIVERGPGLPRERTARDEIGTPSGMNNLSGSRQAAWKAEHPDQFKGWTDCGHGAYDAGTVLDPFSGSGTTGLAAGQLGRKYVGIDLSRKYLDLSLETRLAQTALLDGGAA